MVNKQVIIKYENFSRSSTVKTKKAAIGIAALRADGKNAGQLISYRLLMRSLTVFASSWI
jgi:hypothetical protein